MNREKLGLALLIAGLLSWGIMMTIIVVNHVQTQATPSVAFSLSTVACWAVFFIGKSLLKTREPRTPDA